MKKTNTMTNNYLDTKLIFKGVKIALFLVLFGNTTQAQDNYSVSSIPFQIYTTNAAVQGTLDDTYSAPIPLTFDFVFYGNTYSQINVSTNGYITFNLAGQGSYSPWSFSTTIPDANFPVKNAFLGCYQDMFDNNLGGSITYAVSGAAPYRKFIVLFNDQAHFSCGSNVRSSFQMILHETLNILDVQLIDKQLCSTWNGGAAVTGIINQTGLEAVTPSNRNTSQWTAFHEGWRFSRANNNTYAFSKCDDATLDGYVNFNLATVQNDLYPANPNSIAFYATLAEAQSQSNPIVDLNYTNTTATTQTIYASGNGLIKNIVLTVVDCTLDADGDTVANGDEDLNGDGNLSNDDTDGDGIPNFLDNDDDGDLVLTGEEYVFNRSYQNPSAILDTDNDGILNYIDNDDDGDGILTINEDANGNQDPTDDDTDANGTPNYLQNDALAVNNFQKGKEIVIYPNPASSILNVDNKSGKTILSVAIYSVNGALVKEIPSLNAATANIAVGDLQSGIYFVKIVISNQVLNYKFIKK